MSRDLVIDRAVVAVSRRRLLAVLGLGSLAAACAQPAPSGAPTATAVPPPATTGAAATFADKLKLVGDTFASVLPKLGISSDKVASALGVVQQIETIAGQATKLAGGAGGGTSLVSLATTAAGFIGKIAPIVGIVGGPYGLILEAGAAMVPELLQLAGIHARSAPGAMPPAQAEQVLRQARGF